MEEFRVTRKGVIMETEKTVEEILAVESKVNGTEPRLERQNRLNALNIRLKAWLSALGTRNKGPSLREMDLIVEDIENKLESIKKQDQGYRSTSFP